MKVQWLCRLQKLKKFICSTTSQKDIPLTILKKYSLEQTFFAVGGEKLDSDIRTSKERFCNGEIRDILITNGIVSDATINFYRCVNYITIFSIKYKIGYAILTQTQERYTIMEIIEIVKNSIVQFYYVSSTKM